MKKNYLFTAGLALCWVLHTAAQSSPGCGVPAPQGPVLLQNDAAATEKGRQLAQRSTVMVLPVVFHVFHSLYTSDPVGTGTNVSHQALLDMLSYTNTYLRKQNPDTAQLPSVFLPLAADCGIELCLAQSDPSGNAMYETGVDRINAATSGVPANAFTQPIQFSQNNASPFAWDPTRYLNVWIMPSYFYGTYSGYALFPDSSGLAGLAASNGNGPGDGIFLTYTQVYAQSRLMAHELGHFFGLRHIWGDASCGDDYCNDTPTQAGPNSACPTFPSITCSNAPNGDLFYNYMDYTYNSCQHLFTYDQKQRIATVLAQSPRRRELPLSNACSPAPPQPPVASFSNTPTVSCAMQAVHYYDNSGYQPTAWQWTFPGGSPSGSTLQNPVVTYSAAGTYGATLIVSNASGSDTITISPAVTITGFGNFPVSDDFENMQVPPPDWQLMNIPTNQPPASWQLSPVSAFGSGNYSISSFNWNYHPIRSYLLDFTNYSSPTLSFDYACAPNPQFQPDYPDVLDVMVSTDCSVSYTVELHLDSLALNTAPGAVNFVPTPSQWRHAVANLWSYAGMAGVYVQLYGRAIPNYLYVDNLNLYDQGLLDVNSNSTATDAILVMPNPSRGETRIHTGQQEELRVEVCDITGRKIAAFAAHTPDFILEQETGRRLDPGIYLLMFSSKTGCSSRRLVISGE